MIESVHGLIQSWSDMRFTFLYWILFSVLM